MGETGRTEGGEDIPLVDYNHEHGYHKVHKVYRFLKVIKFG
jgi:hypothetical protein